MTPADVLALWWRLPPMKRLGAIARTRGREPPLSPAARHADLVAGDAERLLAELLSFIGSGELVVLERQDAEAIRGWVPAPHVEALDAALAGRPKAR